MPSTTDTLLTIEQLDARTDALAQAGNPDIEIRSLGQSRSGRDIRMISVGKGDINALVLGVPHPNEPVGALTVEYLLAQHLDGTYAGPDNIRWHFIKAIDPDGLHLNKGWITQPLTLTSYMRQHFRPALANQPEYTFPLKHADYSFDAPTPENRCWQKALELTRPALQASLHHADHGGVFHVISEDRAGLSQTLHEIAANSGLGVNPMGDPGARSEQFAPGVFAFPDIREMISAHGAIAWPAGDSAAFYAEPKYGTFSITTEVPLWHDDRLLQTELSGLTMGELLDNQLALFNELGDLLQAHVGNLQTQLSNADEQEIYAALLEWQGHSAGFGEELKQAAGIVDPATPLPMNMLALRAQLTMAAMRPAGLLRRLSGDIAQRSNDGAVQHIHEEADKFLTEAIDAFEASATLQPVALEKLVAVQANSLLAAAAAVVEEKR